MKMVFDYLIIFVTLKTTKICLYEVLTKQILLRLVMVKFSGMSPDAEAETLNLKYITLWDSVLCFF